MISASRSQIGRRSPKSAHSSPIVLESEATAGIKQPARRRTKAKQSSIVIFTLGHSTRPIEEFEDLLLAHGVKQLVDVRTIPRSRHNPQFNGDRLPGSLKKAGIRYRHMPGLGANLRLLFGYMFTQPGKKLIFMGGEIGQWSEWNHDGSVDWILLTFPPHQGIKRWVSDLNAFYRGEPAMYEYDFNPAGWRWIDANDNDNSVLTYLRYGKDENAPLIVACNFTPVPRHGYRDRKSTRLNSSH